MRLAQAQDVSQRSRRKAEHDAGLRMNESGFAVHDPATIFRQACIELPQSLDEIRMGSQPEMWVRHGIEGLVGQRIRPGWPAHDPRHLLGEVCRWLPGVNA